MVPRDVIEVLSVAPAAIIPQHMKASNERVVHLRFTQYYVKYISIASTKKNVI